MKYNINAELKDLDAKLLTYNLPNNVKILTSVGAPLKKGEVIMKFLFVAPKKIGCEVEDLFETIVHEGMYIKVINY